MPLTLLLLALGALTVGPLAALFGSNSRAIRSFADGLALTLVVVLELAIVLPQVVNELGVVGVVLIAVGAFVPT